jgi:hypothetical protein
LNRHVHAIKPVIPIREEGAMSGSLSDAEPRGGRKVSRRAFLGGVAAGAAGAWALSHGLEQLGDDPAKPPQLYGGDVISAARIFPCRIDGRFTS